MTHPSNRTFVVKLSAESDPTHVVGRVEHVTSGDSVGFEALDQLSAFMAEVLRQEQRETASRQEEVE
jgi:hypothetical protein